MSDRKPLETTAVAGNIPIKTPTCKVLNSGYTRHMNKALMETRSRNVEDVLPTGPKFTAYRLLTPYANAHDDP